MTALGEPTLGHVVAQLVGLGPTPARRHCPNTDRPGWLPPLKFHCVQDHGLQRLYGITCDDYWRLFELQEGRCGICLQPPRPGRRLVVDHDHDTGEIAGLCHFGCNRRLTSELRHYLRHPPGSYVVLRVAPAKLKAIQERDAAKRRRAAAKRALAKATPPPDDEFARRVQAALKATSKEA